MKQFNSKDFNLKQLILERTQREADILWAKKKTPIVPIKYNKVEFKESVGMVNFVKNVLNECRP